MIERTGEEGRARPSDESPRTDPVPVSRALPAAERFEILAGDHLARIEVAARDPVLRDVLAEAGVLESAKRLASLLAEHRHEIAAPLGEQAAFLIERQGELLRGARTQVQEALAELAKAEKIGVDARAERARWELRFRSAFGVSVEDAVLKAEAGEELEGYRAAGVLRRRRDGDLNGDQS